MTPLLMTLLTMTLPLAAPSEPLPEALRTLAGSWSGNLTYVDFGSGEMTKIPAHLALEDPVGDALVVKTVYTDPGRKIRSLDILHVESGGVWVRTSFGNGVEVTRSGKVDFRQVSLVQWEAVSERDGQDDGQEVRFRETWTRSGDSLAIIREFRARGADTSPWKLRNRLDLTAVRPQVEDVLGDWVVDLRPTPDAPEYLKTMRLVRTDGNLGGSFYDSEITDGQLNIAWGEVRFAFRTSDGVGDYYTQGVLVGDRIVGTTHSQGRKFLARWTATRPK